MVDINEVAENIYLIDDKLFSIPKFGSVYLLNEERKALIDTGPATSINTVLSGIKKVGVKPEDIDYLIITHIHLDHSGGAGLLLRGMPKAQVLVHSRGAKHLVDPIRLVRSALGVEGKEAAAKYGEVLPIEANRVQVIHNGDTIRLGEQQILKFIDAPGHAPHELCIQESRNKGVFVGDALGLLIFGGEILLPFHPPPDFDLELAINTINKIMQLKASIIYFAHFGITEKVAKTLQLAREKLQGLDRMLVKVIKETGYESAAEQMRAQVYSQLEPIRKTDQLFYERITKEYVPLWVTGHIKYYQEAHKAYYMEGR